MLQKFIRRVALNLRQPQKGPLSWILYNIVLKKKNAHLETSAVKLLNIQKDDKVLEIGFGPGVGLKEAIKYIASDNGKVYGLDHSLPIVKQAAKRMKKEINENKLNILWGSVYDIPFNSDYFDKIFHCNCYYFWNNMSNATNELYRVIKPHGTVIATLNLKSLKAAKEKGYMRHGHIDPIHYMASLEQAGFDEVYIEYYNKSDENSYQAIIAKVKEKRDIPYENFRSDINNDE